MRKPTEMTPTYPTPVGRGSFLTILASTHGDRAVEKVFWAPVRTNIFLKRCTGRRFEQGNQTKCAF